LWYQQSAMSCIPEAGGSYIEGRFLARLSQPTFAIRPAYPPVWQAT
jgi:hypothetical protein